ncbi:hypothetical protein GCM10027168_47220 [Streptomyces capparidis]
MDQAHGGCPGVGGPRDPDGIEDGLEALPGFRAAATVEAVDTDAFGVCSAPPHLVAQLPRV